MAKGIGVVSNGTDNHLILIKTDSVGLSGKEAEEAMEKAGITSNKNMIPGDKRSPFVTSGVRLGTPAITTRGFKENEIKVMADWIVRSLKNRENLAEISKIREEVKAICLKFPVYS
jgi:glycine hydroxymethyltransferase